MAVIFVFRRIRFTLRIILRHLACECVATVLEAGVWWAGGVGGLRFSDDDC